jgi:hypothetical protein
LLVSRPMRALPLFLLLAACGDAGSSGRDAAPDVDAGAEPDAGPDGPRVGEIRVVEYTTPFGDGPLGMVSGELWEPGFTGFHTEVMSAGGCRLLEYQPSLCDPVCETGFCVDGECRDWPALDAGTLTVDGLSREVAIEPEAYPFSGYGYMAWFQDDLFAEGDEITASAPGAEFPAFSLAARGVAPFELDLDDDELDMPNGADKVFTWPAGEADERMRVTINANNGGHGQPFAAIIECDAPAAAGTLTIPRAMIDAFPETYRWDVCAGQDCPQSTAVRYRRDSAEVGGGTLPLLVGYQVGFYVIHPAAD